jgi:hypothetical protein
MSGSDSTTGALGGAGAAANLRGVRPAAPADGPQIAALLAEAGLRPNMLLEELHWKYWQGRADWPGPRSFVMARGGEILAHAGIVPGRCVWAGGRVRTIHLIDWAARPDALGAGVALLKQIGRLTDALVSIGGSAQTRQILPHLGFRPFGEATGFVRALNPLRILASGGSPTWKILPRLARSVFWAATAPSAGPGDRQAHRIGPDEVGAVPWEFPAPPRDTAIFERSDILFRYVLTCPMTPVELYAWEQRGRPRGYFLLAFAPGQVRLADCWVPSDAPNDWRALIQAAVRQALKDSDAAELVTWASDAVLSRALRECGFHARGAQPIQLLARKDLRIDATTLRVQMLDNDAAYGHHGRAELWA